MNTKKTALFILQVIESFFTSWALMKAGRMEPGNILTGVFFLLAFFLYRHINERLADKDFMCTPSSKWTALLLSVFFTLLYMWVDSIHYIDTLTSPLFRFLVLAAVFLGFSVLFYKLLLLLFSYSGDKAAVAVFLYGRGGTPFSFSFAPGCASRFLNRLLDLFRRHSALCGFFICLLGWLPYFLYQYPGIMTPDSINQFEQALGLIPYSNHHPVAHTLVIKLMYRIGLACTSNMVIALSFYTFLQMCFLAFAVSYLLQTAGRFHVRPLILFAVTLFYALVPYHAVFSVTVWKDVPFAGFVLLFGCSLLRLSDRTDKKAIPVFVISGIMLCLFRSNGWYGFLLCLPFLLYFYRKRAGFMYPAVAAIFLSAFLIKYPVMNACRVIQPDLVESLSIPAQQIAAVICNDRELTDEQLQLIESVVDLTYIKELYNPTYADNIKELIRAGNPDYLAGHKNEFLKLWLSLGLTYPGDYLTAYRYQTYGYWYPDSFYLVAEEEGVSATSLGVSHTPLIGGPLVVKAKEIAVKLGGMVPIYSLLWSMGVVFWVLSFCAGNAFVRKEKAKLICYLPSFALFVTVLIATPVATEFRYVYFMVFSLPFYLVTALLTKSPADGNSLDW